MGLFGFGKKKDEYDYIYREDGGYDPPIFSGVFSNEYDEVYDEDGFTVTCDMCSGEIKWKDGVYLCPDCGQILSRTEFLNYIGAEPPGVECASCVNLYPGCVVCPYGYVKDEY